MNLYLPYFIKLYIFILRNNKNPNNNEIDTNPRKPELPKVNRYSASSEQSKWEQLISFVDFNSAIKLTNDEQYSENNLGGG